MKIRVTYAPRGPGHTPLFCSEFDHEPSPQEVAKRFGITGGVHYQRIIDGSYTIEKLAAPQVFTPT